jgi:hypothetical protein
MVNGAVVAGAVVAGSLPILPSDTGIDGAIPLPIEDDPTVAILTDAEWSAQNKKINDLLAGGRP